MQDALDVAGRNKCSWQWYKWKPVEKVEEQTAEEQVEQPEQQGVEDQTEEGTCGGPNRLIPNTHFLGHAVDHGSSMFFTTPATLFAFFPAFSGSSRLPRPHSFGRLLV